MNIGLSCSRLVKTAYQNKQSRLRRTTMIVHYSPIIELKTPQTAIPVCVGKSDEDGAKAKQELHHLKNNDTILEKASKKL